MKKGLETKKHLQKKKKKTIDCPKKQQETETNLRS
jgi:hypothetical protein